MIRRFGFGTRMPSVLGSSRGMKTDKIISGSVSATLTSSTVIAAFHLVVVPVPFSVAGATVAAAAVTGAMSIFEGGVNDDTHGTSFGSVAGIFLGGIGGYYAKSANEPWRK